MKEEQPSKLKSKKALPEEYLRQMSRHLENIKDTKGNFGRLEEMYRVVSMLRLFARQGVNPFKYKPTLEFMEKLHDRYFASKHRR